MAKIPKDFDLIGKEAPKAESGDLPWDNPGIAASESPIPLTPGEKASNDTAELRSNKDQPKLKCGSGYYDGDC